MARKTFERELQSLQDDVLVLGSMVDNAIDRAIETLKKRDLAEARRIVAEDALINRKRFDTEEKALLVIATQQPMARDLRFIAAVLSIITDLERMGDHAEGIAKIALLIGNEPPVKPLVDVPRMALKAREMLRESLDALVERDAEKAKRVASEDDEIDGIYDQVYADLLNLMIKDPQTITRATYLLWAAHNIERIADRVTNICERVVFMVSGRMEEMNVSSY